MSTTLGVQWEKSQHTAFTLWDIDTEFQIAYEAYEKWKGRHRRSRPLWLCLGIKRQDDAVGKALCLGRQIQRLLEDGKERFGAQFEQGDCK